MADWPALLAGLHTVQLATFAGPAAVTFIPGDALPPFSTNPAGDPLEGIFVAPHVEANVAATLSVDTVQPTLGLRLDDLASGLPREISSADQVEVAGTVYAIGSKQPDGRGWVHLFLHEAKQP